MKLEQKRINLQKDINHHSISLSYCKKELEQLKDCIEVDNTMLYEGIDKFFTVETITGIYEHVLGGDGRSRPWSENREGKISKIKLNKKYYLNESCKSIIKEYVKTSYGSHHVEFVINKKH